MVVDMLCTVWSLGKFIKFFFMINIFRGPNMVAHAIIPAAKEAVIGGLWFRPAQAKR
jgi:hypothetical protein